MEECARMARLTDWALSYMPWFHLGGAGNKFNPFFSEISQQIYKMYEKVDIITQIWLRTTCSFTSMSNAWYLITAKYEQNHHILLQDITTLQTLWKNSHNYLTLAQSRILFYMHQLPMIHVPDHGSQYEKKIHPSIMEECARMARLTDNTFLYALISLRWSGE